ncbi:MAG: alpha/beta fold hydrolase [Pseudomonadota bacterium]|nr:alpha/beta fold hydrolase [Pseudomonadota bacterium]
MTDSDLEQKALDLLDKLKPFAPSAAPGQNFLPPETRLDVEGPDSTVPVWRAGDGFETTLFVHGWDDSHRVWRAFALNFLQNGRPLLLMDLPGHGAARNVENCSWPYAGQAVQAVCDALGPVDTVIAHSFGCLAVASAIKNGARVNNLVLIAPPVSGPGRNRAARWREEGSQDAEISRAYEIFEERTGLPLDGPDLVEVLDKFAGRILLVGSQADESCPLDSIRRLAEQLDNALLVEDNELGHRDLVLAPAIYADVLQFLQS